VDWPSHARQNFTVSFAEPLRLARTERHPRAAAPDHERLTFPRRELELSHGPRSGCLERD
jgi:hypothetical protein